MWQPGYLDQVLKGLCHQYMAEPQRNNLTEASCVRQMAYEAQVHGKHAANSMVLLMLRPKLNPQSRETAPLEVENSKVQTLHPKQS